MPSDQLTRLRIVQCRRNLYFRGGDPQNAFKAGQRAIAPWRGRSESEVLVDRVRCGLKPVGTLAFTDPDEAGALQRIIRRDGLASSCGWNEWGMWIVAFSAAPNATLCDLLQQRSGFEQRRVAHWTARFQPALQARRVRTYLVPGAFDMAARCAEARVNVLESALLYGYPLELAASVQIDEMCWSEMSHVFGAVDSESDGSGWESSSTGSDAEEDAEDAEVLECAQ